MKSLAPNLTALAILLAALPAFTSCSFTSSKPTVETTSAAVIQPGVPGGVVVQTHKLIAKVADIDAAKRAVTLVTPDGKKTTVKCGPEVINFDQIGVGDQLRVLVTEELAVSMATDAAPAGDGGAAIVALAPKGAKPGGVIAGTVQVTATVTAINLKRHRATLQFPDGTSHKVAVRKDVDLTQRKVGEKVVIRTTGVMALAVDKI
jgi:hypothetical protein